MIAAHRATAAASPVPVAPHRRRPLRYLTVLALLALAGCSGAAAGTPPAPPAPPGPSSPGVSADLPADVTVMILPATGEETRWTQGLAAFAAAVSYRTTDHCVRSRGVAMPDVAPPMFIRLYEIPDLAFIRRHGFQNGGPETPRPAEGKADKSIQDACLAEGAEAVKEFRSTVGPIQLEWAQALSELQRRPEVTAAYRQFATCLRQQGLSIADEDGFFRHVDARIQAGDAAAERRLAETYATCMAPVETVREPLRRQLRSDFMGRHSAVLKKLERQLVPQMEALQQRTGITISFPA